MQEMQKNVAQLNSIKKKKEENSCLLPSILGHVRGKHSFYSVVLHKMVFGLFYLNFYKNKCNTLILLILLFQMKKPRRKPKWYEVT